MPDIITTHPKRLIVNADDYGLTPGTSLGILRAHKHGIVTSTSVIANGEDVAKSLKWLKGFPQLGVGVHLTLVDGLYPVSSADVRTLLKGPKFRRSWKSFTRDWLLSRISKRHAALEFASQIRSVIGAGFRVSHLDSHQYLHLLPGMADIVVALALEFGIPFIRVPRLRTKKPLALCMNYLGSKYFRLNNGVGIVPTFGFEETGRMNRGAMTALLERMAPSGGDLTVHPSIYQKRYGHLLDWNPYGGEEADTLCSKEVVDKAAKGFLLTNYAHLSGYIG